MSRTQDRKHKFRGLCAGWVAFVRWRKTPVGIHKVLGLIAESPEEPPWLVGFARGLEFLKQGDLAAAGPCFRLMIERRGGVDGPSRFYLDKLQTLVADPPDLKSWDGIVTLESK